MARYELRQTGPDDSSTYADCWGAGHAGTGKVVAQADHLAELVPAADDLRHSNWYIRDRHRREDLSPQEFWARKCVKAAISRTKSEE